MKYASRAMVILVVLAWMGNLIFMCSVMESNPQVPTIRIQVEVPYEAGMPTYRAERREKKDQTT